MNEREAADLSRFIEFEEYLPPAEGIIEFNRFGIPEKLLVNKTESGKKRTVYKYPREENYILKFLVYQLRKYDGIFPDNLYSFRSSITVKSAIDDIRRRQLSKNMFVYKTDISDYFKSVDISLLLPILEEVFSDDERLFSFLKSILESNEVIYQNEIIYENKGIIPGAPISSFLANVFLSGMDSFFFEKNIDYMRYSDDIIVFAKTREELDEYISIIKGFISDKGLCVNEKKEEYFLPGQPFNFLGFEFDNGRVDISSISIKKLKAKMRRKTRALRRWADSKGAPGTAAARAFIKRFNAKLFSNPVKNELTWTRWFFPVINTDEGLKEIDRYEMECIRYLATGKRTKGRYNFTYEDAKNLGYRNLVNEYYKFKSSDFRKQ